MLGHAARGDLGRQWRRLAKRIEVQGTGQSAFVARLPGRNDFRRDPAVRLALYRGALGVLTAASRAVVACQRQRAAAQS